MKTLPPSYRPLTHPERATILITPTALFLSGKSNEWTPIHKSWHGKPFSDFSDVITFADIFATDNKAEMIVVLKECKIYIQTMETAYPVGAETDLQELINSGRMPDIYYQVCDILKAEGAI